MELRKSQLPHHPRRIAVKLRGERGWAEDSNDVINELGSEFRSDFMNFPGIGDRQGQINMRKIVPTRIHQGCYICTQKN